ncbi:hypothetical protein GGI07_002317 [Coemansia sp. Benny D115]|nr:hypothetical protein GGI07_002317 [Coemansia sp. Benny D115]
MSSQSNFTKGIRCYTSTPFLREQAVDFELDPSFVSQYAQQTPPFGFNGLGAMVYRRTYSRLKQQGGHEGWFETIERVVSGTFRRLQEWQQQSGLGWDAQEMQGRAQQMYAKMFTMKFLPPGRGLWAMGSALTEERRLFAALNNCAFVSTEHMWESHMGRPSRPFTFLMDAAMLGVGVGFDTKGAESGAQKGCLVNKVDDDLCQPRVYRVPDTREGWVESVGLLIDAYLDPQRTCNWRFDYSLVRPKGMPIRGFGGVSSGSEPLRKLHGHIRRVLDGRIRQPLGVTALVDLMNLIGQCVVSGNIRRTAEIAFGDPDSSEYVDLKNYVRNPHRAAYGWTSNNSVYARLGMNYKDVCQRVCTNGEPGFQWMQNARRFGRMQGDGSQTDRDARVGGANPCGEQSLESYEICCLVETFPDHHESLEEFLETLESAFLYAKVVTLLPTHWEETNAVMLRNRRVGTSISGVTQFITRHGVGELRRWLNRAYEHVQLVDTSLSEKLCVRRSVKTTSVKPSGTVSLLAGATPGMHYPESRFCIRRVRVADQSELVEELRQAGYHVERDVVDESSWVVEFPVDYGHGIRGLSDVSMWEQLALAALLQQCWSDNQVSCTVTFDPEKEGPQLSAALDYYQYQLKSVSFLPRIDQGAFAQMPYEAIDEARYSQMVARISRPVVIGESVPGEMRDPEPERYCDTNRCNILK